MKKVFIVTQTTPAYGTEDGYNKSIRYVTITAADAEEWIKETIEEEINREFFNNPFKQKYQTASDIKRDADWARSSKKSEYDFEEYEVANPDHKKIWAAQSIKWSTGHGKTRLATEEPLLLTDIIED